MNPENLLYAKTHEWVQVETDSGGAKTATLGLSAYAVEALTDLVFLELPEVGRQVESGQSLCEIESVKAVSDVYSPVTGTVTAVNEMLPDSLETISKDPYGEGWIAKIRIEDDSGLGKLLDYASYQKLCEQEDQGA